MKKSYWSFILLFVFTTSFSQSKIGYISIQELMLVMPEYKNAEAELVDYQKALVQQGNDFQKELARKDSIAGVDSPKWTPAQKEIKRKELEEMYRRIIGYNEEAQQLMTKREQTLILPIQRKAVQIIQQVGKENGYGYILNKEHLISYPTADDLLPLVLKKLNLKVELPK